MEANEWIEEQPMDKTTLQEFEAICERAFRQREKIDALEEQVEAEKLVLKEMQNHIASILEAHEKQSYQSAYGTVYFNETTSFKLPEGPENKQAFFQHLKQKGIFEDMVSVHSKTLNSYCKKELEAAIEQGNVTYKIPGIGDPVVMKDVRFKKMKGKSNG